ncbi:hypothetical protein V6N13_109028 [Hibiscus sabdariffa]
MATICSVRSLALRLQGWGLGEVKIQRLGKALNQVERSNWLEFSGIPLQCWNHVAIKRFAELWGKFEAFGENLNHSKDCDKVTTLITTTILQRIEEEVEINVGSIYYVVRVVELGFSDNSGVAKRCEKEHGSRGDVDSSSEQENDS